MTVSDACVFAYPLGSSSLRRMALEAKYLGFSRLVCSNADFKAAIPKEFAGRTVFSVYGVEIVRGAVIKAENFRDFQNQVKKYESVPIVAVNAGENAFNRSVLSSGRINILKGMDNAPKNAFDDVCAVNALEKSVAVDIDLTPIIGKRGIARQKALAAYADILKFHRKYGFMLTISSGARTYTRLRGVREISNLCSLFGMTDEETIAALNSVSALLNPQNAVTVNPRDFGVPSDSGSPLDKSAACEESGDCSECVEYNEPDESDESGESGECDENNGYTEDIS